MLDIETEWTPSRPLPKSSAWSESSPSQTLDRSARATSRPQIDDTTNCSRIALGFVFGSSTAFVVEVKTTAGFGFRASATFPFCEKGEQEKSEQERGAGINFRRKLTLKSRSLWRRTKYSFEH
jgi:hypothetical protein